MMRRRRAGLLMVALIFTAVPAVAQTITWQMANEYPATSIHGEGDQFFARELSERSSGRIAITHSFDAALGYRSKDLLDAVARGAVPVADMYIGALGDIHPIFLLPSLPFLAIGGEINRPSMFLQPSLHVLPNGRIVFDHENSHATPRRRGVGIRILESCGTASWS